MGDPKELEIEKIVEAAYDAALDQTLWPGVVERLRVAFNAASANVTVFDPSEMRGFVVNSGSDPAMIESYVQYYARTDPRVRLMPRLPLGQAFANEALLPTSVLLQSECYADWLRPQGLFHGAVGITMRDGQLLGGIALARSRSQNAFDADTLAALSRTMPHIGRAVRTTCRLALAEAKSSDALHLLAALREGALLLDRDRQILYANPAAERILGLNDGLTTIGGKLHAQQPSDNDRLRLACAEDISHGMATIQVERPSGQAGFTLSIQPAGASLHASNVWHSLRRPTTVVFIIDLTQESRPRTSAALASVYHLTASEARVASLLAEGKGTQDAAAAMKVKVATVRWHLQRVFEKTGTSRQAELARLVNRFGAL